MRQLLMVGVVILALGALVVLGVGKAGRGPEVPIVLSATVDGGDLVVRGAGLVADSGAKPFVTLSGERLVVRPGFSGYELRAPLPTLAAGSHLLTVAPERDSGQAAVFAATLSGSAPQQVKPGDTLYICSRRRHARLVDDPSKCRDLESAFRISATSMPAEDDSDPASPPAEPGDDSDSGGDDAGTDSDGDPGDEPPRIGGNSEPGSDEDSDTGGGSDTDSESNGGADEDSGTGR